jgi:hypothetical protein
MARPTVPAATLAPVTARSFLLLVSLIEPLLWWDASM